MHGQVNSRGVARVMNPGANENGQTPRHELLATMAEELLQVQDIATALSVTIRGVEQALPGYEVIIREQGGGDPGTTATTGGGHAGGSLACAVAGARRPFGLLCVLTDESPDFSRSDRLFLQAAGALLSAAIVRLQSESHIHALYRDLHHTGVQRALRIQGNCLVQEINQPITAARNYLYSCMHLLKDGTMEQLPEIARLQAKAMVELGRIGNILSYVRDDMDDELLDMQDANINEIIEAALILLHPEIEDLKIRVRRMLQSDMPVIRVDKALMLQLFFNLFSFSIEAMQQAVKREITVNSRYVHPDQIEIQIADTGHGMVVEFPDNPCLSGSVSHVKGRGIGLAICRKAIDAHHGKFSLSITPGGGSTLHLTLPAHA